MEGRMRVAIAPDLTVEFAKGIPYGPEDPSVVGLILHLAGSGISIEYDVVLFGSEELTDFFRELYSDFRGWSGERKWRSFDGRLRISARHDGHVHLRWRIASDPGTEFWRFSFVTQHGAGEDLRRFADDLDTLVGTE